MIAAELSAMLAHSRAMLAEVQAMNAKMSNDTSEVIRARFEVVAMSAALGAIDGELLS